MSVVMTSMAMAMVITRAAAMIVLAGHDDLCFWKSSFRPEAKDNGIPQHVDCSEARKHSNLLHFTAEEYVIDANGV